MTRLQDRRKAQGLSQSQLANKSDVNVRMIQRLEITPEGVNKTAAITVYKLAQALDTTIEDLLEK